MRNSKKNFPFFVQCLCSSRLLLSGPGQDCGLTRGVPVLLRYWSKLVRLPLALRKSTFNQCQDCDKQLQSVKTCFITHGQDLKALNTEVNKQLTLDPIVLKFGAVDEMRQNDSKKLKRILYITYCSLMNMRQLHILFKQAKT